MLPLVTWRDEIPKSRILTTEAWMQRQFPIRLNNMRRRWHSTIKVKERGSRAVKCLCELSSEQSKHSNIMIDRKQQMQMAHLGCIIADGQSCLLKEALEEAHELFMMHLGGPMNRKTIIRQWGQSELYWWPVTGVGTHHVTVGDCKKGLLKRFLKTRDLCWALVLVMKRHHQSRSSSELLDAAKSLRHVPAGTARLRRFADEFNTLDLWRMWGIAGRLALASERKLIRSRLTAALRLKGLALHPNQKLVVSCSDKLDAREIRALVIRAVARSRVHHKIAKRIQVRVIRAPAPTALKLLCNHKGWIAKMSCNRKLKCQCKLIKKLAAAHQSKPEEALGHWVLRSRNIWPWSLKSELELDAEAVKSDAWHQIWHTLRRHLPRHTLEDVSIDGDWNNLTVTSGKCEANGNLRLQRVKELMKVSRKLAVAPMDKSPGEVLWMCPRHYENLFDKMFTVDDQYYTKVQCSEAELRARMQTQWRQAGWKKLGTWNRNGEFPTPYVMPKAKDLCKGRPIVPYTNHVLKQVYKVVGRAHSCRVANMAPEVTFNITNTAEFPKRVTEAMEAGRRRHGDQLAWSILVGDLSNMYTELEHQSIESAVSWEMTQPGRKRKVDRVAVERRGRRTHTGAGHSEEYITVSSTEIQEVSAYDNANMILWIKGRLVKQSHGCPMGSNLSPAKAVITCAHAEAAFLKDARRRDATIMGCRYMDDLLLLVAYNRNSKASRMQAEELIGMAEHMYPKPLVLERSKPIGGEYEFLETKVTVEGGDVWVRLKSKNEGAVWNNQPFVRLLPHPGSSHRGRMTLTAALHRCRQNSNYTLGVFLSSVEKVLEFWTAGYSLQWIIKVLSDLSRKHSERPTQGLQRILEVLHLLQPWI